MSNNVAFSLVDEGKEDDGNGLNNIVDERNCSSLDIDNSLNSTIKEESKDIRNSEKKHFLSLEPCNKVARDDLAFFFDLDNTIYPKSSGIDQLMVERIELFFVDYLKLPREESKVLGARFYKDYGLAIKGLMKHFSIDPVEYDRFVDGGLPLEEILKPNRRLTCLVDKLSKRGACWIFTNAGKSHATRVLKLLKIDKFFSGIIYCDYSETNFPSKPDRLSFLRAMKCASINDPKKCFFFDDSIGNIRSALEMGWRVVYVDEDSCFEDSSIDEINTSLEISTLDNNDKIFPTVKYIEDIDKLMDKFV